MLNVKYLIFDQQVDLPSLELIYSGNKTFVYKNNDALPRAYFVSTAAERPGIEVLNMVKEKRFDPKYIAFVDEEIGNIEVPDTTAFVNIVEFKDEHIELDVNASGNNFMFLGDTYYTSETEYKIPILNIHLFTSHRWKAYVDNTETQIYKVNHGFRGIVVPKGNHRVEFKYSPESFEASKTISLIISVPVVLISIGYLLWLLLIWLKFNFLNSKELGNGRKSS